MKWVKGKAEMSKHYQWEKRLADLSQILINCEKTYFDPNLFRMNTNHFLQTARTVTFIIQKNKKLINNYETWYQENVINAWKNDSLMSWAKDSRNTIEKEGDIDLYSEIDLRIIYSYIEDQDIVLKSSREALLSFDVEKLIRYSKKSMPEHMIDLAVIKIERRWVANSLPNWELLSALAGIHDRILRCCNDLRLHLQPNETQIESGAEDLAFHESQMKRINYVKVSDPRISSLNLMRVQKDINFSLSSDLKERMLRHKDDVVVKSSSDLVELYSRLAPESFLHFGSHIPILYLFDEEFEVIDLISTQFDHQTTKYIFWRYIADLVAVRKPFAVMFIAEAWIRDAKNINTVPMAELLIKGEILQLVLIDKNDEKYRVNWTISRVKNSVETSLSSPNIFKGGEALSEFNFLTPVKKSLQLAWESRQK